MERRVLVTGASRGIGRAIAVELAGAGFRVGVNYRASEDAARAVCDEIASAGGQADLLPFDVSDREAVRACLDAYVQANGAFWGVVVNAGVTADGPLASM